MKKLTNLFGILLLTSGMAFMSCSKDDPKPEPEPNVAVTGVSLNKKTTSLTVGSTEILTATVAPNNATNKTVTWTSSVTTVATVDNNGVVTALAEGNSLVIVTAGNYKDTCIVTVTKGGGVANNLVKIKLGDFAEWTADTVMGITTAAKNVFSLTAKTKAEMPLISFITSTQVTPSGQYSLMTSAYFKYYQDSTFWDTDGNPVGDWISTPYTSGGTQYPGSAGVVISSFDPVGLTISGTLTGFLVSGEDIVDQVNPPRQKALTGSFTNINLTVAAAAKSLKTKNAIAPKSTTKKINTNTVVHL